MVVQQYSEKQMTRWISANTPPVRDGRYQLMTPGSLATFDAWFQGGDWQVWVGDKWCSIELNPVAWRWRGLRFDPGTIASRKKL